MGLTADVLDPWDDRVERVRTRVGQSGIEPSVLRQPLQIALGREDGIGLAILDAIDQFFGTGPFGRDAFLLLRIGWPIAGWRGGKEEEGIELSRLLERGHPPSEWGQPIEVQFQFVPVEKLTKILAIDERLLKLQSERGVSPADCWRHPRFFDRFANGGDLGGVFGPANRRSEVPIRLIDAAARENDGTRREGHAR